MGTEWKSAVTDPGRRLTSTIARPPARATFSDLSMRPMPPRRHTTMRPATWRESSAPRRHWPAAQRETPGAGACCASTARPATRAGRPPPVNDRPPGAATRPRDIRPTAEPTVVTQGEACAAYADPAELPAAPMTTMSASAAPSSARWRVSMPSPPASARLSTSTRSATAASTADTTSAVEHPSSAGSGAPQHAL